jgi:ATP-dependent Lon protease
MAGATTSGAILIDELQDTLKGLPFDDKARAEINELTDTLRPRIVEGRIRDDKVLVKVAWQRPQYVIVGFDRQRSIMDEDHLGLHRCRDVPLEYGAILLNESNSIV